MEYIERLIYYLNNKKFEGVLDTYTHKLEHRSEFCGDVDIIYLNIIDDIVKNISYENSSCSLNISFLEILCDFLIDKNCSEIAKLDVYFFKNKLNFPDSKLHCVHLILNTLKKFR